MVWFGKQARGALRHVDGSYIKLHQHGLQGSKLKREKEAIGLSRGGMTTKLLAAARLMLGSFRGTHVVGDKGFDSLAFRRELLEHGAAGSTIPRKD